MATTNGLSKDIPTQGQIQEKKMSPLDKAVAQLSSKAMKQQFATACPTHLKNNAERYIRQFCTQIRMNPKLLQCDYASLLGAMLTGTALGLDPTPSLGEFYIIPYGREAQFQLGYKGMVALAYRGGVKRFAAFAVHEKDEFEYELGLEPRIKHKPYMDGNRGEAIAYYAIAKLESGDTVFEIMTRSDVEEHAKKYSRTFSNGPWKTEFDEMAKKTVAKALFKWIPKSTEIAHAVVRDGTATRIDSITSADDVLDAEVTNIDESREPVASLEAGRTQPAAPIDPNMIDFPLPEPSDTTAPASTNGGFASESEKLKEQLREGLRLDRTEAEAEAWCVEHFNKGFKSLNKDDLKAAIGKLNAELDARDR
jgi:recombination protein RecT